MNISFADDEDAPYNSAHETSGGKRIASFDLKLMFVVFFQAFSQAFTWIDFFLQCTHIEIEIVLGSEAVPFSKEAF